MNFWAALTWIEKYTNTHTLSLGKRQRQMCPQNGNIWLAHYCRHKHTDTAKFSVLCLSPQNAPQWSTHSWNPVLITATHTYTRTHTHSILILSAQVALFSFYSFFPYMFYQRVWKWKGDVFQIQVTRFPLVNHRCTEAWRAGIYCCHSGLSGLQSFHQETCTRSGSPFRPWDIYNQGHTPRLSSHFWLQVSL